jgi:hypothetical protein
VAKEYTPLLCGYGCPFMEHDIKNDTYRCKVMNAAIYEDPFSYSECVVGKDEFDRYALRQLAYITTAIGRRMDLEEVRKARKQNEEQKPDAAA